MPSETLLQIWSVEQSSTESGPVSVRDVSFEDVQLWLSSPAQGSTSTDVHWKTELLLFYTDDDSLDGQRMGHDGILESLIEACDYAPLGAFATTDTVEFNSFPAEWSSGDTGDLFSQSRSYSISDNVFGVCWKWDRAERRTRGLMYGCRGEGTRQMEAVLQSLPACYQSRASPLLIGLLAMEAEVTEMRQWISNQSEELANAHVQTGHHNYANIMRQTDTKALDLANLSRDVCGLAVNITTSVLCLLGSSNLATSSKTTAMRC